MDSTRSTGIAELDKLRGLGRSPERPADVRSIFGVERAFIEEARARGVDISAESIRWPRQAEISPSRMVAMMLAREILAASASFPTIAGHFGLKDHTSAMHAFRTGGARACSRNVALAGAAAAVRMRFALPRRTSPES